MPEYRKKSKNMLKLGLFDLPARFVNNELAPFGGLQNSMPGSLFWLGFWGGLKIRGPFL